MDRHQKWYEAYLHAMHGYRRALSTSVALANHHVKSGFGMARYYINRGDGRNAYGYLGWVLHTMQDSTSPAHKYFQPWDGSSIWSWKGMKHVMKEAFMWQANRSNVYRATHWVWNMFSYRLVPSGNVFIF